jgi:hypothetical protein
MPLLRRASEQTQSEWRAVPDGLWRWQVSVPELRLSERYGKYQVRFPLWLTEPERQRLMGEHPMSPTEHAEGVQQSWRSMYTVGLSLGFMKDGQYQSTKLVDFLAACLGQGNSKKFREWIGQGGGPPRPDDLDDQQAEIEAITEWLKWWENLEVYGTITQRPGENGTIYANFAGPMPIGSLPGQRDPDYEALGRGKLRAIIAESGETRETHALESRRPGPRGLGEAPPAKQFTSSGHRLSQEELDDLPF